MVKLSTFKKCFSEIFLLLVAKHSNVGCSSCDALRLAVPDDRCGRLLSRLWIRRCKRLTCLLLRTKNFWLLVREAPQILCDFIASAKGVILAINHHLLLLLPFAIESADFEMFFPFTFVYHLLTVGTLHFLLD